MIKITEKKGFTILPEGNVILKITEVDYDAEFGKMTIKMVNKAGISHNERYSLQDKDGEINEKALGAFSFFARTALQLSNDDAQEIDEQELVGKYIKCRVEHEKREGTGQYAGKTYTNARLKDYEPADGFAVTKVIDL